MTATQPDFFADVQGTVVAKYPFVPGAKREGTSQEAAQAMTGRAETLRDQVLAALKEAPGTSDEVADRLGKSVLAVRPRVSELAARGLIAMTGQRRENASGLMAAEWRAL